MEHSVVDPDRRALIRRRRVRDWAIEARALRNARLRRDPPALEAEVEAFDFPNLSENFQNTSGIFPKIPEKFTAYP